MNSDTCKKDKFRRISSIEGQLEHALVVDHLTNAGAAYFDQSGIRFNFDLFGDLTYFQNYRDNGIAADLQYDSALHVAFESRQTRFHHVRSDRHVR